MEERLLIVVHVYYNDCIKASYEFLKELVDHNKIAEICEKVKCEAFIRANPEGLGAYRAIIHQIVRL
ncbi:hypothetical protein MYX07_05085 [Patescibacteria group bacterium AH-259-L07]|nr:hypothetical protein [Patescibacteria group bacterium AH-259-L07]